MNREELLKISKELLESIIYKKNIALNKEHILMLSISSFIMSEEKLIKTDSRSKKLFFDDTPENIKKIDEFYDLIKDKISFKVDSKEAPNNIYEIVVLNNNNDNIELKKKIFIINKLRDSFAHGRYEIDIQNNQIIIKNEYDIFESKHSLTGTITPKELNEFNKIKLEKEDDINIYKILGLYNEEYYSNEMILYLINQRKNFFTKMDKLDYDVNFNDEELKQMIKTYDNALMKVENFIHNKKILNYETYKINGNINKTSLLSKDEIIKGEKEDIDEVLSILVKISLMLCSKEDRLSIESAVIYNHLSLLFSDRQNIKLDFKYLKNPFKNIQFKLKDSSKKDDVTGVLGTIRKNIYELKRNNKKSKLIPKDKRKEQLLNQFNSFINNVILAFEKRNIEISKRIRNGIMHSAIEVNENGLVIKDSPDHKEDSYHFKCTATNQELLEYISIIENDEQEELTIEELKIRIENLLKEYEASDDYIKKFKEIYEEYINELHIDKKQSIKEPITLESTKEYTDRIKYLMKLRDTLIKRKEELDSKPPSM